MIESSIVIHTLTPKNYISVDVYCCKAFDPEVARQMCRKYFDPVKIDDQYIERGMDYYKSDSNYLTMTVTKGVNEEREVVLSRK